VFAAPELGDFIALDVAQAQSLSLLGDLASVARTLA
jgi:hypothetical protein